MQTNNHEPQTAVGRAFSWPQPHIRIRGDSWQSVAIVNER